MQIESNALSKEIERIKNDLADIPFKTFYGLTIDEFINKIVETDEFVTIPNKREAVVTTEFDARYNEKG